MSMQLLEIAFANADPDKVQNIFTEVFRTGNFDNVRVACQSLATGSLGNALLGQSTSLKQALYFDKKNIQQFIKDLEERVNKLLHFFLQEPVLPQTLNAGLALIMNRWLYPFIQPETFKNYLEKCIAYNFEADLCPLINGKDNISSEEKQRFQKECYQLQAKAVMVFANSFDLENQLARAWPEEIIAAYKPDLTILPNIFAAAIGMAQSSIEAEKDYDARKNVIQYLTHIFSRLDHFTNISSQAMIDAFEMVWLQALETKQETAQQILANTFLSCSIEIRNWQIIPPVYASFASIRNENQRRNFFVNILKDGGTDAVLTILYGVLEFGNFGQFKPDIATDIGARNFAEEIFSLCAHAERNPMHHRDTIEKLKGLILADKPLVLTPQQEIYREHFHSQKHALCEWLAETGLLEKCEAAIDQADMAVWRAKDRPSNRYIFSA